MKPITWLAQEFKEIDLGDKRLTDRCNRVVKALGKEPKKSIPSACGDWGSAKGVYRFLANKAVTRQVLLAPHRGNTVERCRAVKEVVVIHDTMYWSLTHHPATEGLGPIGTAEGLKGLVVHQSLAVELDRGEVLGLLEQEVWARQGRKAKDETSRERRLRDRESQCWPREMKGASRGLTNIIHVADRESDIYEVLEWLLSEGQRYVIRASKNRRLAGKEADYLFESVHRSPVAGKMTVAVGPRPGRKGRMAHLTLRRGHVTLRAPVALDCRGPKLTVGVVEALEDHPPKGCEALKWVLFTGEPLGSVQACARVVMIYSRRWKIEEFHMGLKTGCGVEDRQLETRKRMEAFLGLASVMSVMLLRMRDAARGGEKASVYLTEVQIKCLRTKYPSLDPDPTARDALRTVARLGGFLARKGDGEPGWRTLWQGMEKVLLMEHGYLFAKNDL
jgi:hypothetical protein